MGFNIDKTGRGLVEVLKNRAVLLVGIIAVIILWIGYFVFYSPNKANIPAYEPIVIVAAGLLILIVAIVVDYREKRKTEIDNAEKSASLPDIVRITSLEDGLKAMLSAIEARVSDESTLVIWRIMPYEITERLTSKNQGDTIAAIRKYNALIQRMLKGGEVGSDFWDETIYGHVTGHGKAADYLNATWTWVRSNYFTPPYPETSGLGFDPNQHDWLILVGTSSANDDDPSDFICALELGTSGDTLRRPSHGFIYHERQLVHQKFEHFRTLRERLINEDRFWNLGDYSEVELKEKETLMQQLIMNGTPPTALALRDGTT